MKTIVFIGTNKSGSSREAMKAAERMGYITVLLTDKDKFMQQRTEFPDVHEMMFSDFTKKHLIQCMLELELQGKEITGILSFIESYVHIASELSDEWGIASFSTDAIRKMENKIETQHMLDGTALMPFDVYYPENSLTMFLNRYKHGKRIVKSPASTEEDVLVANDLTELERSIQHLSNKHPDQPVFIEEYQDGPQYLVETIIDAGMVHIIAVVKQEFAEEKPFSVTDYSLQKGLERDFYERLYEYINSVIKAFPITKGACHLKLKFVHGEWKLIEVSPRISGGAMNAMIEKAYGINLVEQTIRLYLGETPQLTKQWERNIHTHYVTINASGQLLKVTGRKRAARCKGVEEIYIKPKKGMIVSSGKRYAYAIAKGDTAEQAKINAQTAAKELQFYLEEGRNDDNWNALTSERSNNRV